MPGIILATLLLIDLKEKLVVGQLSTRSDGISRISLPRVFLRETLQPAAQVSLPTFLSRKGLKCLESIEVVDGKGGQREFNLWVKCKTKVLPGVSPAAEAASVSHSTSAGLGLSRRVSSVEDPPVLPWCLLL